MDELRVYEPHEYCEKEPFKLFLAGTIDNGQSIDWQTQLIEELKTWENAFHPLRLKVFNPRREHWPKEEEKEEIHRQIQWELHHLELADLIVMNILGNSKSPISLMELGLFAKENKLMVFCPKEFYRYNNVEEVCTKYRIPLYNTNDIKVIARKVVEKM